MTQINLQILWRKQGKFFLNHPSFQDILIGFIFAPTFLLLSDMFSPKWGKTRRPNILN